jgi:predicted transcriptional regulator
MEISSLLRTIGKNEKFQLLLNSNLRTVYVDKQQSKFELYLELLTQVKYGNYYEDSLLECTNLSQLDFDILVEPLVTEKLLKHVTIGEGQMMKSQYQLTSKGDQLIDFLVLGLYYVESKEQSTSEPEKLE